MEEELLPGIAEFWRDEREKTQRSGAEMHARVLGRFRQQSDKSKDRRLKFVDKGRIKPRKADERKSVGQGELDFLDNDARVGDLEQDLIVPRARNISELFGLDELNLLRQSEYAENLASVLYAYHGKNVLTNDRLNPCTDPIRHFLQSFPGPEVFWFLTGVGKTHGITFLGFSNRKLGERRDFKKILIKKFEDWVFSVIDVGEASCSLDLGKRSLLRKQIFNISEKYRELQRELLFRYSFKRDFRILGRAYGINYRAIFDGEERDLFGFNRVEVYKDETGFHDSRTMHFGKDNFTQTKEHPGKDYMRSIIEWLRVRDYVSNGSLVS